MGNMGNTRPFGEVRGEQLEILLDGERVALVDWDEALGVGGRGRGARELAIDLSLPVEAGPHTVGVTFLATNLAPSLDLNDAFLRSTIETGGLPGFTFHPHVGSLRIDGRTTPPAPAIRRVAAASSRAVPPAPPTKSPAPKRSCRRSCAAPTGGRSPPRTSTR